MTGLRQHLTTKYGYRTDDVYVYPKPWPKDWPSLLLAVKSMPLDTLSVISSHIHTTGSKKYRAVWLECGSCKKLKRVLVDNILSGKSRQCECRKTNPISKDLRANMLRARYEMIVQRCDNPNNPSYHNYGGRGVECRFTTAPQFIHYVLTNLPHENYKGLDIDRIDNNGHYEPGNLRLARRGENLRNKRTNVWVDYKGERVIASDLWLRMKQDYPDFALAEETTKRYALNGLTWQDILSRKPRGPYKKRTT